MNTEQFNTRIMHSALALLDDVCMEDIEIESLTLVWPGKDWSGPVPDGDWVYIQGNRRGFRRHYIICVATGEVYTQPIKHAYTIADVKKIINNLMKRR